PLLVRTRLASVTIPPTVSQAPSWYPATAARAQWTRSESGSRTSASGCEERNVPSVSFSSRSSSRCSNSPSGTGGCDGAAVSTAAWPTFLAASSPNRIRLPATTKPWSEELTSGGSTSIPSSWQRLTKNGTLSLVDITEEISAAMYSAG